MKRTILIGLTGGIGSGKSTVAKLFKEQGVQFVDADDVAREVVMPGEDCLNKIEQHFGPNVINADGTLNRPALREKVFSEPEERKWLESVTHPAIRLRLAQHIKSMNSDYALLVHPLLFETQQNTMCDYTIAISVPRETQINRVMTRDQNTQKQVERIIDAQLSNQERCDKADFILENTGNTSDLSVKVCKLHNEIKQLLFKY